MTPPRPPGPSEAEIKVDQLTRQLEEEMEKSEEQGEFFGSCHACQEKVTGAGQACQVSKILERPRCSWNTGRVAPLLFPLVVYV